MLNFESNWRYESPGSIPPGVSNEFSEIIGKLAKGEQRIIEHFKTYFSAACGSTSSWSSNASWADSDLQTYMGQASDNAPMFIEAFYDACESLRKNESLPVPDIAIMNKILAKYEAPYKITPPDLESTSSSEIVAPPPEIPLSLDENTRQIIQASMSESQRLFSEGRHRQAVQELLWLLETVSTVFQGITDGEKTIQGKYFNKIIDELRKHFQGGALKQVIEWIKTLHGFLSAPTGGGIRHGMHLKDGVATTPSEARLYCNLITSYISFLLSEYDRLKESDNTLVW